MASANHGNAGRSKSSVWDDFHRVCVSGAAGACAMARCNRCGTTLQADAKKHGTSHLRRHANSSCCARRAAERDAKRERDAKCANELVVKAELNFPGRLVIQGLDDELVGAGRGSHAVAAGDDGGRLSPNFIPDALPQAPSSSSTRFFRKKRERSASSASQEGETADNVDHSSRAKDWVATFDKSIIGIDLDFGCGDCFARTLNEI